MHGGLSPELHSLE